MGSHAMSQEQCMRALRSRRVGRIAVTDRALPVILPVTYLVVDGKIAFRVERDGLLARTCRDAVVAFEIDGDHDDHAGRCRSTTWSVLAVGIAEVHTAVPEGSALAVVPGKPADPVVSLAIASLSGLVTELTEADAPAATSGSFH